MRVSTLISRFRRDESGVALVEFAVFLPLFLLSFFVVVEFSRIFFSYQGAIVGVRDATRYLARVSASDLCVGEANDNTVITAGDAGIALNIIQRAMQNENSVLPVNVAVNSVSAIVRCVVGAEGDSRQLEIPIVRVRAQITITLPLGGILEFNGQPLLPTIDPVIFDESRVFGV